MTELLFVPRQLHPWGYEMAELSSPTDILSFIIVSAVTVMIAAGFLFVLFGSIFLVYLIISTLFVSVLATPLLMLGLPILLIYLAVVVFSPSTYYDRHPWKRHPVLHSREGLPDGPGGRMMDADMTRLTAFITEAVNKAHK